MPLPAMKRGKKPEFEEEGGGISGGSSAETVAEELTGDNWKLAEPLIPVFGEETMKKLFNTFLNYAKRSYFFIDTPGFSLKLSYRTPSLSPVTAWLVTTDNILQKKLIVLSLCKHLQVESTGIQSGYRNGVSKLVHAEEKLSAHIL